MRAKRNFDINRVEFVEHPLDSFFSGSLPVLVECVVKNAGQTFIECKDKVRNDLTRNVTIVDKIKHEKLSLLINRKDFESDDPMLQNDDKIICKCIAYSHVTNQKYTSEQAVITNSCNKMDDFLS